VEGQGEAADLGVADGVFAAGVAGRAAAHQASEGGVGECCAGQLTVAVIVGVAQQCAEPVDLRGAGYGESTNATGCTPPSTGAWIFVVSPPRELSSGG